jgi:hypothetical protein
MLTGPALLNAVKSNRTLSKAALARVCGYTVPNKDGTERARVTAFLQALLEAKGVQVLSGSLRRYSPNGRHLPKGAKVRFNGSLVVSRHYTELLGLNKGDLFDIELGENKITLTKRSYHRNVKTTATEDAAPVVCPMPSPAEQGFDPATGNPLPLVAWAEEPVAA